MIGLEVITLEPIWFYYTNNNMTEPTQVTQDEFDSYVEVQESGITNMFNVNVVSDYSGLSRDKIMTIMQNYTDLNDKYGH